MSNETTTELTLWEDKNELAEVKKMFGLKPFRRRVYDFRQDGKSTKP